jgi:hypothetical protein
MFHWTWCISWNRCRAGMVQLFPSMPTRCHMLWRRARIRIAAVDLHFKMCPFLDTKLPATYAVPITHSLGHPAVRPTPLLLLLELQSKVLWFLSMPQQVPKHMWMRLACMLPGNRINSLDGCCT